MSAAVSAADSEYNSSGHLPPPPLGGEGVTTNPNHHRQPIFNITSRVANDYHTCKYTPQQVKQYYTNYAPIENLWEYFKPPRPETADDLAEYYSMSHSIEESEALRDWSVGKEGIKKHFHSAPQMRDLLAQSGTGRCDAGAIHLGPLENLATTRVLSKQYVVDLDMTEYEQLRTMCKCGTGKVVEEEKARMCHICINAGTAVSRVLIDAFEKLLHCKKIDFLFSGGRGFHIRIRDYKVQYWGSQKTRKWVSEEVLNKLQTNYPQLCEPLRLASSRLGFNLDIIMDDKVSKQSGKLTRVPFSIHQATGRVCTFFKRPEDMILIDQVPTIAEVLKSNAGMPCRAFANSLDYLQSVL